MSLSISTHCSVTLIYSRAVVVGLTLPGWTDVMEEEEEEEVEEERERTTNMSVSVLCAYDMDSFNVIK